ncbi:1-acyl-sn-glycerol-3-phosphate acyltransferase [Desulforamulus profundi]|uniref:1-acyl-sn-glycerol-3-phosphate acyltransferase n=1 Tax=Desulforamulus profundi TaxID=1383067 RepID=A0A2C6MCY1_9FIRM|nr:lysophospholipid acyltransferase family protein [Desulforamulus profundi]MCL5779868.1 1-acyl-sn-glycerol-3-phosphate acyltransferase [Bacillota bacterium]PHJ37414.1 1-acyl-sn-glycerol-3-phosphate acyltransferase [Desulforamulus profundi]
MFYTVLRVIIRGILLVWRRWEVIGLEHLPAKGGLVVVSNHVSNLDPVVVGCALTRRIHFMAKVELFKIPVLATIITLLGAFPVNREKSDRHAIRKALELLQTGNVVGVFPEGTRSKTGELQKPHIGAAMLAVKANVPILPMALKGTRGSLDKITVVIGEPVYLPELWRGRPGKEELEALSEQVMGKISGLLE